MRILLTALSLIVATLVPAHAETPVERHGQLRVEGTRIVDAHGAPVVLRGMSFFWSQWGGRFYTPETVKWLRDDWNATVVRAALAVEPDGYLANPEAEVAKVERVIDGAIAAGVYVLVDWHAHQPHPKEAAAFFTRIARKYGHLPNIIYETYNEPLPEHDWAGVVKPYHMTVIAAIRAIDPDNLVIAGTPSWSQDVDVAAADPLPFTNIAYTLHFYAGTHGDELRAKADAAIARGAALFVTEWGTSEASGAGVLSATATRAWWDFIEARGLSNLNWSFIDKDETSAALMPGAASTGGWPDTMLTPSGLFVRAYLRSFPKAVD